MLGKEWDKWRGYVRKIGMIGLIMLLILPNMLMNPISEVFADEADYDIAVDGETVTIVSYLGTDTDVTIPEQIQGKDVAAIANLAFQGKTLDKVTIPRTVATIGAGAFMGSGLESLILNEGLIDIGAMAFAGNRMANVDIPGTVTTIGAGAFSQGSLSTLTLHEGLETIGEQAFWSNELTSVIIPEGVATIGEKAFILNKLEEVTLPSTITSMGSKAFLGGVEGENNIHTLIMQAGLSSIGESAFQENLLETVQIPGSVSVIEKAAFMGNKIQSVVLNAGIEEIGEQAFEQNQLEEVVIPDTVTHIASSAFSKNQLHALTLPDSVGVVGTFAFGFNPLTEVKVYNDEVVFEFAFGMPPFFRDPSGPPGSITLFGHSGSTTEAYALALPPEFGYSFQSLPVCGDDIDFECVVNDDDTLTITGYDVNAPKHMVIPDSIGGKTVTNIEEIAFRAHDLTGVELPNSLIEIGRSAFYWNSITTVTIPSGVTSVEDSAFSANLLVNVSIPDSVTTIETYAFYKNSLTEVTIPSGVDFVGRGAFSYNPLTIIHFEGTPTVIDSSAFHPGFFAYPDFKGWYTDENFEQAWDNTVPAPMTIYGKWEAVCGEGTAFNCKVNDDGNTITITGYTGSDTDVIIPGKIDDKDVTAIGEEAFAGKQLVSVELPYSVMIIEAQAFSANDLTSVTIMNDDASIEESAFEGNQTNPTELTIYGCPGSTAEAHANDKGYSFAESLKAECLEMSLTPSETNPTNQNVSISVNVNKLPESINELNWAKGEQSRAYFQGGGGQPVISNAFTVSENDTYTVYVEDVLGRERIATILIDNIDKTPPEVTGVTNGEVYDEPVTISFNEGSATLNGIAFTNEATVNVNGEYELIVTDGAGNETIVMFELKQSDYIVVDNGSGTVMITGYRGTDTSIEIPSILDGKVVTAIGNNAFSEKSLEDVIIPDSVAIIGDYAFEKNELQEIEVPGSVRMIGHYAFRYNNLASVTLSEGLETIGKNAFLSNAITELIIPDTVTFIDHGAFVDNNIMELTLGANVQTIAAFAFYVSNIQEVTIPESVQSIGMGAFQQNQIKEFTVLGNEVILDKNVLHVMKPGNPEQLMIRGYCDSTANKLASNWGYSFQQLDANECLMISLTPSETELTNQDVTVQINVVSDSANVVALKWAQGSRNLIDFQDEDGDSNDVTGNQFTVSANDTYTVYVKDRSGNEKVEHIRIDNIDKTPPAVTGVTSGEVYDEPVTISFNEGIAALNGIAFTSGTAVTVNGEYELIVTDGAGNVTTVMFELKQSDYIFVDNGSGTVTITGYRGTDSSIEIPSTLDGKTVTIIGNYAFSEKSLERVMIPDSVASIGAYAFYRNGLQEIEIPGSVKTLAKHAFSENHLTSVTFSEGLETIGQNAFWNNHITELTIPDTVTLIDYGAFVQNDLTDLTLGENIQTIAAFAFWSGNLQEVTIPASVQSIGEGAFMDNQIQQFTVLNHETVLDRKMFHDRDQNQNPENPEQLMIRGYCGSTANELANDWGYSFQQLDANECLMITLTPSETELTNQDVTVQINVVSDSANVVALKWAQGSRSLVDFQDGNGNDVTDNQFTVSANGTYTVYVKDRSGNEKVEQIRIANIDKSLLKIKVQIVDGETITLHVHDSDSIQQLKQRIEDHEGIAPENQKMIFGETVLEDGRTLADYTIPDEATLQLIILSSDTSLIQLGVELKGERAFELDPTKFDHDIGKTEQKTIEIFATANDPKAMITLNGASFDKTQFQQLNVGNNAFTMIVTAENGHEQTYTIIVNRQAKAPSSGGGSGDYIPSSDISLDKLEVMINGENRLPFNLAQFKYDLGDTEAEAVEIIVKAHDPKAKITLDGEAFADKKTLLLNEAKNIFNIVIVAENGDEQTYIVTVNRLEKVPFADIAGHWAEGYIKMSYWENMFYGYSDKTFRPDDPISRIEVTSVLARLLELDEQKQVPFIDVQSIGKDAMKELEQAYANGVVKGYPDQTFKPYAHMTRAHLALILYRTYEKVNRASYKPKQLTYFSDIADYDQETQHAIAMLVELKIAEGFDWNFMPNEQVTRAEAAKMLVKFKEVLGRLENN